mgnify:CR=1 FL=1
MKAESVPVGTLVACPMTELIGLVIESEASEGSKPPISWSQLAWPPYIRIKWSNGEIHWMRDKDVEVINFP